jgi:hypothetical protein
MVQFASMQKTRLQEATNGIAFSKNSKMISHTKRHLSPTTKWLEANGRIENYHLK